jgi:hypothetical protein
MAAGTRAMRTSVLPSSGAACGEELDKESAQTAQRGERNMVYTDRRLL